MKVYRYLNSCARENEGSYNELYNFMYLGLISPSNSYLKKYHFISDDGINTFEKPKEMSKFFFSSIADALFVATKSRPYQNMLIELDIDEKLLRKYLGLGFYGTLQVEYCIPYQELYEQTKKESLDYLIPALNFYNQNFSTYSLTKLDKYPQIEALLANLSYSGIYQKDRLSIYPLFCFMPKEIKAFPIQGDFNVLRTLAIRTKNLRERNFAYLENVMKIAGANIDLFSFNPNFSKDKLFDYSSSIIEEENKKLRKILFK